MAGVLDVVATEGHLVERLDRALDASTRAASALAPDTLSWSQFVATLAFVYLPSSTVASAEVERLTLAEAVRAVLPPYDAAFSRRSDIVEEVGRSVSSLRRQGVGPAALRAAREAVAGDDQATRQRLETLAEIVEVQDARLAREGWLPRDSVESALARALAAPGAAAPEAVLGAEVVRVWHLFELPSERVAFLVALAASLGARGGRVELHIACEPRRARLPTTLDRALRAFEAVEAPGLELQYSLRDPHAPEVDPGLGAWVTALAEGSASRNPVKLDARRVRIAEGEGPEEELRWVVAQIVAARDEGVAAHEIAVVFRSLEASVVSRVAAHFDEAAVAYSPPPEMGPGLLDSALARAVLRLPTVASQGANREDVLGLLAVLEGHVAEREKVSPWRVASALRRWGVETLFDTELEARCRFQLEQRSESPALVEAITALAAQLWDMAQDGTPAEHAARLLGWLPRAGGEGRFFESSRALVSQVSSDPGAPWILRALGRDEAALSGVAELLSAVPSLARELGRDEKMSAGVFAELLIDLARVSPIALRGAGSAGRGVVFLDAASAVGRSFRVVVVPHLTVGAFPARRENEAFWGDSERQAVTRSSGRWVHRGGTREDETALLLATLAAATERVLVTAARHDEAGRATSPSPFFRDLSRTAGVAVTRVGRDPLARARQIAPRGFERVVRSLSARVAPAEPLREVVRLALASSAARADIEQSRERYFAHALPDGDPFNGRIDHDPELVEALHLPRWASAMRPLDVTLLERVARCGFKAFAHYVLGIEERVEENLTLDDKQRGHLLHELLQTGTESLSTTAGEESALRWEALDDALSEKFAEFGERVSKLDHGLVEADYLAIRRQAEQWLGRRMNNPDWAMLETEVGFGPQSKWPGVTVRLDGQEPVSLRGRIDGVERVGEVARAVEFKSGRGDGYRRRLYDGALDTQFQLVVYAAALERARQANWLPPAVSAVDGLYVGFRDLREYGLRETLGGDGRRKAARFDVEAMVRDGAAGEGPLGDAVRRVVLPVRQGRFEPRPRDCNFCQYRPLCRVEAHDEVDDDEHGQGAGPAEHEA